MKKNSVKKILQKTFRIVEKIIDHKAFVPFSLAILVSFSLFNGGLFLRTLVADYQEKVAVKESQVPIKIRITKKGKVLDFDQVQIVEKRVEQGDNILNFLFDIGVSESDSFAILDALKKVYNPRSMVVGNSMIIRYKVKIRYDKSTKNVDNIEREVYVDDFIVMISPELQFEVSGLGGGKFEAKEVKQKLTMRKKRYVGKIEDGLFVDATAVGASPNAVMNMINLYGYSVDFQRDIQKNDEFEIVVESFYTESGRKVRDGNILFAMLKLRGRENEMYGFEGKSGLEYYDKDGVSVRRSLLRTPVNGARISSRFGYRRHPVLGYSKLHKGVDFAAPTGTPIFAAGKGVIVYRGRYGGYGNFIKIRHNSTYQTAYAHMSRFNQRFRNGSRVKQGDVIGYVGSTGRSTGPHLHFEVLSGNRAINPASVKTVASAVKLKGEKLKEFKKVRDAVDDFRFGKLAAVN